MDCWHPDPSLRPNFNQIAKRYFIFYAFPYANIYSLTWITIQQEIEVEDAAQFWLREFVKEDMVRVL